MTRTAPLTPTVQENDHRFYVAASTIPGAGRGVFAREHLQAGDCLEVLGILVAPGSISDLCTAYGDAYKYRVNGKLLIPLGFGGMVNHSSYPNLEKVIEHDRLWFRAIRAIAPKEELFLCYSEYARERFRLG